MANTRNARKLNFKSLIGKITLSKLNPVISTGMALAVTAILIAVSSPKPVDAFRAFGYGIWGQQNLIELFVRAAPILLIALGATVAFKARVWNIGFEGQMYMGAILGTFVVVKWLPGVTSIFLLLPLVLLAGFAGGAAWALIAGVLKIKLNVNEIITTLMMIYVAIQINDMLLFGPLRQPGYAAPQSIMFPLSARLPILISGTRFHTGIIIAVILIPVIYLILSKTSLGSQIKNVGLNEKAAYYAGTNVKRIILLSFLISGGLAGLAGMMEVTGIIYRLNQIISPGYGFIGIAVALLGRMNPFGAFLAAILFAAVMNGAKTMHIVAGGVSLSLVSVIQGIVILFVLGGELLTKRRQ